MDQISRYMDKHQDHIAEVFHSLGKNDTIEATKVFTFMQNSFNKEQFIFSLNKTDFFGDDENGSQMEKLLESYYRQTQEDPDAKFYLYRVEFTLLQIKYILEFWLGKESNLKIVYNQGVADRKPRPTQVQEDENQFDIDNEKIPELIKQLHEQIDKYQAELAKGDKDEEQTREIIKKVQDINIKIKVLEQRLKAQALQKEKNNKNQQATQRSKEEQAKEPISPRKVTKIDYQAIFQFYARQNHLTGVKTTFDRIEHETQSLNYQKLVHFLRQFSLMPTKTGQHKKVHILYIKNCQKTRDLSFQGFMKVIEGVSQLIFDKQSPEQRQDLLKQKFLSRKIKGLKLLNNPFHSLEREDFRINVEELTYNFKLKPQDGKFVDEIVSQLELRRKVKQSQKMQKQKSREIQKIRQLKKIQAIDPFDPQVLKNSKLLEHKQEIEPIASLENIEKYRDSSFDFEGLFGVKGTDKKKTPRNYSLKLDSSMEKGGYRKSDDSLKKVEQFERYQMNKMNSLVNGIIQRSNAKMQKLGISPKKSVKFD